MITNKKSISGFSLIEMLVSTVIFAILAIVGTQIVTVSLRDTNKGEKVSQVRENIDYAFNVIARELRNAEGIDVANSTSIELRYYNSSGLESTISCLGSLTSNGRLMRGTARITGTDIVVDCGAVVPVFAYQSATATTPYAVTISVTAYDARRLGIDGAAQSASTRIIVRSF